MAANELPSSADHDVDGHGEALKRYMRHRPMQHVQGYTGSHWIAAIGRLLTPYCLGGCQGDSKQNKDVLCTHFDGHFGGHHDAAVLYHMHRPMEEVQGFHIKYKPLNTAIG